MKHRLSGLQGYPYIEKLRSRAEIDGSEQKSRSETQFLSAPAVIEKLLKNKQMNRLIYDIEIEKCIPSRIAAQENLEQYSFCKSWTDYEGMGISVIGYQYNNEPIEHCLNAASFFDLIAL